jgi:hypothetical protein
VLLTYGGHPACQELMRGARMKSVAVVFLLHNSVTMSAASLTTSGSRRPAKAGNRARPRERPREALPGSTPRSRPTPRSRLDPAKPSGRGRLLPARETLVVPPA